MDDLKAREKLALEEIKKFSRRARALIEGITVDTLTEEGGLNPYMTAALGLSLEDAVEMFIHRRVERSLGTSFGDAIENFLIKLLGGKSGKDLSPTCKGRNKEKPWFCWWDVFIERPFSEGGQEYKGMVLAVKSSSTNVNKDIVERFIQHAKEAEKNGYRPYLVFTYGKRVWSVVKPTMSKYGMDPEDYVIVGRQIYDKLLGAGSNYYDHIIESIVKEVKAEDLEFSKVVEKKREELLRELKARYGDDVQELLKDLS